MNKIVKSDNAMQQFGKDLAKELDWPFCLELVGDVGAGKTTLVKGLATGLGSSGIVSSPSFTINNRYELSGDRVLSHYDFYRLNEAGVISHELDEDLHDENVSVVVEWGETVGAILPDKRHRLSIDYLEDGRELILEKVGQ